MTEPINFGAALRRGWRLLIASAVIFAVVAVFVPVSGASFAAYGASSTPTIVLIDGQGIVRLYHPGALTEKELTARILTLITK